jgi:hypothetical protein
LGETNAVYEKRTFKKLGVDWIHLAQDKDRLLALENTAAKFWDPFERISASQEG